MTPTSPYKLQVKIITKDEILPYVKAIQEDILDNGLKKDLIIYKWYKDLYHRFSLYTLVFDEDDNFIAYSGNDLNDNSIKILCHLYVIRKYRTIYRSITQTDLIPFMVDFAENNGYDSIWYSMEVSDPHRSKYATSQKRHLNGGKLDSKYMPFWKDFEYVGQVVYNHVIQEKFEKKINKNRR